MVRTLTTTVIGWRNKFPASRIDPNDNLASTHQMYVGTMYPRVSNETEDLPASLSLFDVKSIATAQCGCNDNKPRPKNSTGEIAPSNMIQISENIPADDRYGDFIGARTDTDIPIYKEH